MKLKIINTLFAFLISLCMYGESPVLIVRGDIHNGAGNFFPGGLLISEKGILSYCGEYNDSIMALYDTSAATVEYLDYGNRQIYPGLIALNTTLGITEIDLVRATHDYNEVGDNNADVRSVIAYNTDSKVIPTVRSNGILHAEVAPQGGRIAGQSSLMCTSGHNWEGSVHSADLAIHLSWPQKVQHKGWWAEPQPAEVASNADEILELKQIFDKAYLSYMSGTAATDAKSKALFPLFDGSKRLFVQANNAADIVDAVLFFKSYSITPCILGAKEADKITSFLKEEKIPVVLIRTHALPNYAHNDVHSLYVLPRLLSDSGISFAITDQSHWQQRNLAFQAGTAAAYGLNPEKALTAITLSPARILGVDSLLGSLEAGKEATFIVSEGDLLDMKSSVILQAYIKGQACSLDNKQKALYESYRTRFLPD